MLVVTAIGAVLGLLSGFNFGAASTGDRPKANRLTTTMSAKMNRFPVDRAAINVLTLSRADVLTRMIHL